jgi:3-hydroxyacyl-CoA dehydrogenase
VVGNDAPNFSAGANLMLLLLEAQEGNWDEIDMMIRAFQGATQALRFADVPVIVAPAADARRRLRDHAARRSRPGGGRELHRPRRVGVGLIPGGGGTKEMLARAVDGCRRRTAICCRSCSASSRRSASRRCRPARPTRGASASSTRPIA